MMYVGKRATLALLAAMSLTTSIIAVQDPTSLARWEPRTPVEAITASATVSEQTATTPSVPGMFDAFTVEVAHVDFLVPCGPERWCPPPPPQRRVKVRGPPRTARCASWEQCRDAIARCESGGDYNNDRNTQSTASGKYQVLNGTWDGYAGYARAVDAPPEVQEAWAREAFAARGVQPWEASRHCWG